MRIGVKSGHAIVMLIYEPSTTDLIDDSSEMTTRKFRDTINISVSIYIIKDYCFSLLSYYCTTTSTASGSAVADRSTTVGLGDSEVTSIHGCDIAGLGGVRLDEDGFLLRRCPADPADCDIQNVDSVKVTTSGGCQHFDLLLFTQYRAEGPFMSLAYIKYDLPSWTM